MGRFYGIAAGGRIARKYGRWLPAPKTKYLAGAFYAKITIHSIHPVTAASLAGGVASAKPRANLLA